MSGIRDRVLPDVRRILGAHLRTIVPVGIAVVIGVIALLIVLGGYAGLIGATAYDEIVASITSPATLTLSVIAVMIPILVIGVFGAAVWAGTVVHAASAAYDKRRASMRFAVWNSIRSTPRAVAVAAIIVGAVLGAILAAPVFLVVGVVGLLLKRGDRARLIPMAIPFGVAVLVLARWGLALPGVWLDGLRPRAAIRESSKRVRGHEGRVLLFLISTSSISVAGSEAAAALAGDPVIQLIVRVAALIVFGGLPLVAATVLYRGASAEKPAAQPGKPLGTRARVAVAVVMSLVLPTIVAITPSSSAQAAAPSVDLQAFSATSLAGENYMVMVTVSGNAPTGQVTLEVTPPSGPEVTLGPFTLSGLGSIVEPIEFNRPAGVHTIVAHYLGDANNPPLDSAPLTHTIVDPTVNIGVTSTQSATGDTVTLNITVTPVAPATAVPTGTITIDGSLQNFTQTLDPSGTTSRSVVMTPHVTRDFLIIYSGNVMYPFTQAYYTAPRIPTTTTATMPANIAADYGDTQTFTGVVRSATGTTPTGTVDLVWKGAVVASGTVNGTGGFSITTDQLSAGSGPVYLSYQGDEQHEASDDGTTASHLEVDKATSVPVVTLQSASPRIGVTTKLIATLADIGTGPTGLVTFETTTGTPLGSANPVDGVASIDFIPTQLTTFVRAVFAGDTNYDATTSAAFRVDATQALVDVAIPDPGNVALGATFDLTATVSVAGGVLAPDHGVDFGTGTGTVIASNVPVIGGVATITVCAGAHVDCPSWAIPLGVSDLDLKATYAASSINLLGESAIYEYRPGKAATVLNLVVNPTTILYGSAVYLTATVTVPGTATTPTGTVTFYGVEPGGAGLQFLGNAPLVNGVARLETQSGTGIDDLRWPADAIKASYFPGAALFRPSSATVSTSLTRIALSMDVYATVGAAGTPSKVTVVMNHAPGASEDYTQPVTVTADNGSTCTITIASGQQVGNCFITWSSVGTHTLSASYPGDLTYLPGDSGTVTVTTTRPTPVLGATVPSTDVLTDTDTTVTWNRFDPTATGTVQVWADGTKWCEVSVQVLSCTGRFGDSSATGGFVDVIVQYSGDPDWLPLQQTRQVRVIRCAILDVRSSDTALGTVSVNTAPNCGATGYLPGSAISVTATAKTGGHFAYWMGYTPGSAGLVKVPMNATGTFTVTRDPDTWVRVAKFVTGCYPITANVSGYGGISVYPASNCTTDAGAAGWLHGTTVSIYPDGAQNPSYGEPDGFWSFGALPPRAVVTADSSHRPYVKLTVTSPASLRVSFGPICRTISVAIDPDSPGDGVTFDPAHNCSSPAGGGYLRYTKVTATATPGDPSMAITGWKADGVPVPEYGTSNQITVEIDQSMPALTATVVHCYSVDVRIDGVVDRNGLTTGDVRVDGTACPDGSERYLGGTEITLTPVALAKGTLFNGWDDQRITAVGTADGDKGDITRAAKKLVLDRDIRITAGFYDASACSQLDYRGDRRLLDFVFTGCGPGYYLDTRKQQAAMQGIPVDELTGQKYFGSIIADVVSDISPLDTYVMVKGVTAMCPSGSNADANSWKFWGVATGGRFECRVSGPVSVWTELCQPVDTKPVFTVAGRSESFDASAMPGTVYLKGPDGLVVPYDMSGFQWSQGVKVLQGSDGKLVLQKPGESPCTNAGENVFEPGTDLLLYAAAPSTGFRFTSWTGIGPSTITKNPIRRMTNAVEQKLTANAHFTVTCHTVTFGAGITIDGDAPRCPGSSEADNSFIAGTAIKVRAQHMKPGDRSIQKFESGVIAGQIYEDPKTLDLVGYAFVDGNKNVAGLWQNRAERETTAAIKGLKVGAGIIAVVLPVVVGVLVPPAGIFFAALGTLSTISSFIPGAEGFTGVTDLLNPTKITECVARWGFDNSGKPSSQSPGSVISTANTIRKVVFTNVDIVTEGLGPVGAVGGVLSIGAGLYTAGIGNADLSGPESLEELAGKSTIAGCLDEAWRITGSEVGGGGSQAG